MKRVTKVTLKKREKRRVRRAEKQLWAELKAQVNNNQKNRCYMCNKEVYGKSAHHHHIIERNYKLLKYDLNNIVLLCPKCHKLSFLSVHSTSIWFSYLLERKDEVRYYYLINKLKKLTNYETIDYN